MPFRRETSVSTLNRYQVETSKCKNSFIFHVLTAGAGKAMYRYVNFLEGNFICPFVFQFFPPAAVQPSG